MAKGSTSLLPSENPRNSYIAEQAADAVLALINSKPRSPSRAELVTALTKLARPSAALAQSSLHIEIDRVTREHVAACAAFDASGEDEDRLEGLQDRLQELVGQLPVPPAKCSLADIISWAQVAFCWADKDRAHWTIWTEAVAKANAAWAKLHALDEAGEDNATVDAAGDEAAAIDDELGDVAPRK